MARHANRVKAKIWSGTLTCELEGPLWGACASIFEYIRSQEERDKAFAKIKAAHERMRDTA